MAFCISIDKVAEDDLSVEYEFEDFGRRGRLRLEKQTGQITALTSASSNIDQRAARKVWKHWEAGNFPDHTQWAS